MNKILLEKYANLIVKTGIAVKKNQLVNIKVNVENYEFSRMVAKACYEAGSGMVSFQYIDNEITKLEYQNLSVDTLTDVKQHVIDKNHYEVDNGIAKISLVSPDSFVFANIDPKIISEVTMKTNKILGFVRDYSMNNQGAWCLVYIPNQKWAKQVFPNLSAEDAVEALWNAIFKACRITLDNDPVKCFEEHLNTLKTRSDKLNEMDLKELKFKNSLGTNLSVGLAMNHNFAGGANLTKDGHRFVPNIPTEEIFGMPHKLKVNGTVVATKPLNYQNTLIDGMKFEFKDGVVTKYEATKGYATLKSLIEFDKGSSSLGEVALISHNSPISNMNLIFYSTLYDENASCHLALGRAYAMNIKGGTSMTQDELSSYGANFSGTHVDFMFGSSDMSVIGITKDNKEIEIFRDGNFII